MLTIRDEQMDAFQETAEAAFAKKIIEYLKENHGDEIVQIPDGKCKIAHLPETIFFDMVFKSLQRAKRFGFSYRSTLKTYVVLRFVVAPNFDEHPIIKRILTDENIPADDRIDQLWERTSEQNWEAAEQNYDTDAWGIKQESGE
ncbi:MAG: hypothetical protein AB1757_12865 [Acidobacteriota bacterium]